MQASTFHILQHEMYILIEFNSARFADDMIELGEETGNK